MSRLRPRSLFGRLLLLQGALAAALGVTLPLLLSHTLAGIADGLLAERLAGRAENIVHRLDLRSNGLMKLRHDGDRGSSQRFAVFDATGASMLASARGFPFRLAEIPHGRHVLFFSKGRYDILVRPVGKRELQAGWLAVASDRTHPEEVVDDVVVAFLRPFFWVVPAALLVSLGLSVLVMRRMTSNIRRTAATADRIGISVPEQRIDETGLPNEALPLVHAANRAIDRMSAAYQAQKDFASAVAHELRTPLALLSLHTEALPSSPAREQLQSDIAQANHVVRQLMDLASIDRLHPTLEAVDALAVAREVVEAMAPLVYGADHTIALEAANLPSQVTGVRSLIGIALTNLIENAVRHTPPGSSITVIVDPGGDIVVQDDGPGITYEERDYIGRLFRRSDTARSDSAGLGLTIIQRIMTACQGALEIEQTEVGARMRLRFDPDTPAG